MKKIFVGLSLFALLLAGCNNSGGGSNPPIEKDSFTVTWKNFDGAILEVDENVPSGAIPSYDGSTPIKEKTENYEFAFSKWSPDIQPVTQDTVYTALFDSTLTAAYVSFDLNGGTTSSNSQSRYMASIEAENFFFDVKKENYNFRGWEYNSKKVFDGKGNKINNVEIAESMTFKALFAQTAYLTISSNLKDAGTISGEGEYNYNTNVSLNVNVNEGYEFIGWYYEDGTLLSNQTSYPFMMWNEDVTIIAKFDYKSYNLHVQSYNNTLGLVLIKGMGQTYVQEQEMQVKYQSKATIVAYTSTEVGFLGWFDDEGTLIETNAVYEFVMPHHDYKLVARWNSFRLELSSSDTTLGTVNDVSGNYSYNDKVNLIATPNVGSEFVGWYLNDEELISTVSPYEFSMLNQNASITARFKLKKFNVNVYTSDSNKGTVEGSGDYEYGSEVTLTATPNADNSFKGWYINNELLSKNNPYTFNIGNSDLLIEGKFAGTLYTIKFVTNGGDPIDDLVAEKGDPISINPTRNGYSFVGWYTDSSCSLTTYFELGDTMPAFNGTLYAKWSSINYSITYHLDARTTNNPSNPSTYNILSDTITLLNPTVSHGTFNGWYTDSEFKNSITKIIKGSTGNLDLYAKETATTYTINFVTNGGNSISPITGAYGDPVVIPTPTKGNSIFVGWFTDESLTNKAYISTMPGENITLYAKWAEMYTVFEIDSKQYMYFGTYPQSVVSDTNVINELTKITTTNSRGYYEYNGCEYARKQVNAYSSSYTYSNGSNVVNYRTEYFKVEPILWRVLKSDVSGNYTLLADQAINSHRYDGDLNNYAESDIRSWINSEFFNSAFKSAEKGAILTTNVDNSPSTTNSNSNSYACENTDDKVFLLSYKDYINPDYGFSSSYSSYDSARYCKPTDYAIANYCYMYTGGSYDRNCYYWTRSPDSDSSRGAWYVDGIGYLYIRDVSYDYYGVRPALNINL